MGPQVVAAIIAAVVSVLTLVGTLAAQFLGRRATSRDTEKTLEEQRRHLDRTLAEQTKQLDRTLAEQRTRTLNERFATAADQLGSIQPAPRPRPKMWKSSSSTPKGTWSPHQASHEPQNEPSNG
jgi:hypothetical protein